MEKKAGHGQPVPPPDKPMDEKLNTAIKNALAMIRTNCKADEALKFSQAAKNLAETYVLLKLKK